MSVKVNMGSRTKAIPREQNVWTLVSKFHVTKDMFQCRQVVGGSQADKDRIDCILWPNIPAVVKCSSRASDCQISAAVEDTTLGISDFVQKYWRLPPALAFKT